MWRTYLQRTTWAIAATVAVAVALSIWLWQNRPSLADINWPVPSDSTATSDAVVTVTWLGVTTLLFDDGETQILIDGFFSRPTLTDILLGRNVDNDAATINYAMNEFRIRRLAAIIPVHSHFDHAMDIGAIANRSSASIVGSESSAAIARGAGVPEDQITVVADGDTYQFGRFSVTLKASVHAPIGWRGSVPLDGVIDEAITMPQPIDAFRVGKAYSIVISHPEGTAVVQGSAGFIEGELQDVAADVVMLGVAQITALGRDYAEDCWLNTVTATGAQSVYALHFDDYTQPFGVVEPWPKALGNLLTTAQWLQDFRDRWDTDTSLFLPEFGVPIVLFAQPATET